MEEKVKRAVSIRFPTYRRIISSILARSMPCIPALSLAEMINAEAAEALVLLFVLFLGFALDLVAFLALVWILEAIGVGEGVGPIVGVLRFVGDTVEVALNG